MQGIIQETVLGVSTVFDPPVIQWEIYGTSTVF